MRVLPDDLLFRRCCYIWLYDQETMSLRQRLEWLSPCLQEFGEKLHILQPAGVHISTDQVNEQIQEMSHYQQGNGEDPAEKRYGEQPATHVVDDHANNSTCHSQCQQAGVDKASDI
jgi:hypothetical protein